MHLFPFTQRGDPGFPRFLRIALFLSAALTAGDLHRAAAQSIDWNRVHTLTLQGIHQLYNMHVDQSLVTFREVSSLAPADPRGHFFEAMVAFWKFNLLGKEEEYDHFLALSDTVIDVCEAVLDRDKDNAMAHFFLGGIYGYRGMAKQARGSTVKAVFDGRKGYMNLEDAVEIDPKLYDAQMGLGIFEYMIAKAPRSLSWILRTIGFEGSIDGGLASLKQAAERGTYATTEARFFLSQFMFNESRDSEAFQYMRELTTAYPDNILFLLNESTMYRRRGNFDSAFALASRAMAINERRADHIGEEFLYSTFASLQFALNDFAGARKNYALYLDKLANKALVSNWVVYRYGLCQEIEGDRTGAVKTYSNVRTDREVPTWEERSTRMCRIRLATPLTRGDIYVIMAGNLLDRKQYNPADSLLELTLKLSGLEDDTRGEALYDHAQILYAENNDSATVSACTLIRGLNIRHETWIPPNARFLAGTAYARMGEKEKARDAYRQAKEFDGYDYASSLKERIQTEEKRLELP